MQNLTSEAEVLLDMDFLADVRRQFLTELLADGITVPPRTTTEHICTLYFGNRRRRITVVPRTVSWSAELLARHLPSDILLALHAINAASIAGDDLNTRLSRHIINPDHRDMLLHEWGIYHLHLGAPAVKPPEFVQRRDELLFVHVTAAEIFFIDVLDHKSFASQHLIEVLHRNRPDLIAPYREPGITVDEPISESTRTLFRGNGWGARLRTPVATPSRSKRKKKRRKKPAATPTPGPGAILMLTTVSDGTVYFPPGGGYTSSGDSLPAVREALSLLSRVSQLESTLRARPELLRNAFPEQLHTGSVAVPLILHVLGDSLVIEESNTQRRFEVAMPDK